MPSLSCSSKNGDIFLICISPEPPISVDYMYMEENNIYNTQESSFRVPKLGGWKCRVNSREYGKSHWSDVLDTNECDINDEVSHQDTLITFSVVLGLIFVFYVVGLLYLKYRPKRKKHSINAEDPSSDHTGRYINEKIIMEEQQVNENTTPDEVKNEDVCEPCQEVIKHPAIYTPLNVPESPPEEIDRMYQPLCDVKSQVNDTKNTNEKIVTSIQINQQGISTACYETPTTYEPLRHAGSNVPDTLSDNNTYEPLNHDQEQYVISGEPGISSSQCGTLATSFPDSGGGGKELGNEVGTQAAYEPLHHSGVHLKNNSGSLSDTTYATLNNVNQEYVISNNQTDSSSSLSNTTYQPLNTVSDEISNSGQFTEISLTKDETVRDYEPLRKSLPSTTYEPLKNVNQEDTNKS